MLLRNINCESLSNLPDNLVRPEGKTPDRAVEFDGTGQAVDSSGPLIAAIGTGEKWALLH